jgi:hypothetical protein
MSAEAKKLRVEPGQVRSRDGTASNSDQKETRLNLVYRGTAMRDVLDTIQQLGHHGTVTEAVAAALRKYETMLKERERGNLSVIRFPSGPDVSLL